MTIETNLTPLLEAMTSGKPASAFLIQRMPSSRDMSRGLRRWLKKAGVDRHELHHRTPTTQPMRFHDLRATGITWRAVRGDKPLEIMLDAGHEDFETTKLYIHLADANRVLVA